MDEQPDKRTTGEHPGSATPAIAVASLGDPPPSICEARGLTPAAERIADSASSLVKVFSEGRQSGPWQRAWHFAKSALVILSVVVGGAFALEQYLAAQHVAARTQTEALLASASNALASPHDALQASAVRTLARIGQLRDYDVQPGTIPLGRHLWNGLVGYTPEYPFFERSWMLFRDFAMASRLPQDEVVSSALLSEGSAWENRIRSGEIVTPGWSLGSLLYGANLVGAHGISLDLRRLHFGPVDLTSADLTASNCSDCGLLGARLDRTVLRSAILMHAYLAEASMHKADMSFARMDGAVLRKVKAQNVTFTQTVLSDADFTGALLDGAKFTQATLHNTIFARASLRGAVFVQTDVSSASFQEANVDGADFTLATGFSESTLITARNADKAHRPPTPQRGGK